MSHSPSGRFPLGCVAVSFCSSMLNRSQFQASSTMGTPTFWTTRFTIFPVRSMTKISPWKIQFHAMFIFVYLMCWPLFVDHTWDVPMYTNWSSGVHIPLVTCWVSIGRMVDQYRCPATEPTNTKPSLMRKDTSITVEWIHKIPSMF